MGGDYEERDQEDVIPGSNDKPSPVSQPGYPGAPDNLTHIPAQGGEVAVVLEPQKP